MGLRGALTGLLLLMGTSGFAQDRSAGDIVSPILIINQERLIAESSSGAKAQSDFETEAQALAAENAEIEAALIEEERALTEARATLSPDAFRTQADEFDSRVQRIRAEQDQKARAIQSARDRARQTIVQNAGDLIREIAMARGALVVLDQRSVLLSADAIDITDAVIARINEADADER